MKDQHFEFQAPSAEEYGLYRDNYLRVLYIPETEEYMDRLTDREISTVTILPAKRQKAEALQFACTYIDRVYKGHRQVINHGSLEQPRQLIIEAPDTMWRLHLDQMTDDLAYAEASTDKSAEMTTDN